MAVIRKKSEGDCTFKAGLKRRNTWVCQPCRVSGFLEQLGALDRHFAAAFGLAPCRQVTLSVGKP